MKYYLSVIVTAFTLTLHCLAARAQPSACPVHNLLQTVDAQTKAIIEKQAAETENGQGRFWKIEKPGLAPSWLLGTMHVTDERVTRLSEQEKTAFQQSGTLVLEVKELAGGDKAVAASLAQKPDLVVCADCTPLKEQLTERQFKQLDNALKERNLSYALMAYTRPWVIWASVTTPPCEAKRQAMGGMASLDTQLGRDALAAQKPVVGLETAIEQYEAMSRLPAKFYIGSILQAIEVESDKFTAYHMTMTELYLDGKISMIEPFLEKLMPELPSTEEEALFKKIMIEDRNAIMASRAAPLLAQGNIFIAVGAMHLIGKTGLVEQFRKMGYHVTPATNQETAVSN